jgi:uncharacterized protein YggE
VQVKAVEMAREANSALGEVISVSENSYIPQPFPMYKAAPAAMGISSADSTPDIQPGAQDVTDDVTITYALR